MFKDKKLLAASILVSFAIIGGALLFRIHAATPYLAAEPENGTVAGPAVSVTDASAGGGKAIKFATGSAPPPSPPGAKPNATNTGVPDDKALTTINGNVTVTTNGTVIDKQYIKGFLTVRASNVIVRNTHVEGGTTSGVTPVIRMESGSNNLLENVTVTVAHPAPGIDGVNGSGFTARRLNISGSVDGMKLDSNTIVENSYIHDLRYFTSDPSQGGGPSHNDSIQILSGGNIQVRSNNLDATSSGTNAAIQVTQDFGAVTGLNITDNWMDGGGCTLNIAHKGRTSLTVNASGNKFGHRSGFANCPILLSTKSTLIGTGNVWDTAPNAGQAVPIQQHD